MQVDDSIQLAKKIQKTAIMLGYEKCGIIGVNELRGYSKKLSARINRFPDTKAKLNDFYRFSCPDENYPWVKSVVICVRRYGKYKIPERLNGMIAKYYMVDSRVNKRSADYQDSIRFEQYLNEQGIKTATDRKFGITALRWAAMKAGLGIVRKNNFFYTESGSWVYLEAWFIDRKLELKEVTTLTPCSEFCNLCMRACPTNSLSAPYEMSRSSCVSCITTWDGWDMPNDSYREQLGSWIYGCDACQDACPYNRNKWIEDIDFPGLEEIANCISLEQIIEMDYQYLQNIIQPKFWYIKKQDVWKWKVNALNAMYNSGEEKYQKWVLIACCDENEKVRQMANFVKAQIQLSSKKISKT